MEMQPVARGKTENGIKSEPGQFHSQTKMAAA